jgi:thiamine transporter ThiT
MIFVIGSVLLGAVLGRFYKVLVLVPACGLVSMMVVAWSWYTGYGMLHTLGAIALSVISLQVGYASGMLAGFIPDLMQRLQHRREHNPSRATTPHPPMSV